MALGSSAEGCFCSWCGALAEEPSTLHLWHPGGCAGIPPCWDPHGWALDSSSWLLVILLIIFKLKLAINSSDVRAKRLSLRLAEFIIWIFQDPSWWNLIKHHHWHCAHLPVFVMWLIRAGFTRGSLWLVISAGLDVVSHSTGTLIFLPHCSQISVGFSRVSCATDWSPRAPREGVEDREKTWVTRTLLLPFTQHLSSGKRWNPGTLLAWSVSYNENYSFCCFLLERSNILQEINKPNPNAAPCQIKTDCFSLLSFSIQQTSCESCTVYETTTYGYLTSSPPFPSFLFLFLFN